MNLAQTPEEDDAGFWDDHAYRILSASALTLIAAATVLYHVIEGWSWVDSLYFSVVAVTTVGFGDLVPTTDAAKLVTVGYIVIGLSLIGLYLNVRLERRSRRMKQSRRQEGS